MASEADESSIMIRTVTDIVNQLVASYDKGEKINLTKLKKQVASKNRLGKIPHIVDIL